MVLVTSALVLIPVGIIYLKETYKGVAFTVVALFGFLFAFILISFNTPMIHVVFGLTAYLAVLVNFLT